MKGRPPHRAGRRGTPSIREWISLRVELIEGQGKRFWPRPSRVFAAAVAHTFGSLAIAIDDGFARWDRSHLYEFELSDGTRIGMADPEWDAEEALDAAQTNLSRLALGEQFIYVFDLGDEWTHLCTVGPVKIDPLETLGIIPGVPLPYVGWGDIPDQYARRWDGDDGDSPMPPDPNLRDLPALCPWWGARSE